MKRILLVEIYDITTEETDLLYSNVLEHYNKSQSNGNEIMQDVCSIIQDVCNTIILEVSDDV